MSDPVICFALTLLFDDVIARFETDCTNAENRFGWREPGKQKTSEARIVWVPGDPAGKIGELGAARNPGGNPRSLATLRELFTVYISDRDSQFPEDERKQYEKTRALYDAWYRAVYLSAHGTIRVVSQDWNTTKNERRAGAEIACVCWVESKIPDQAYELAPSDTEAQVTTSLDDVDEITTTVTP